MKDNIDREILLSSGITYTSIYTYTCKKTGLHIVNGNINFNFVNGGGIRAYEISTNGSTNSIAAQVDCAPTYGTYIPVSFSVFMTKGDKIVFSARQNSGNPTNVQVYVSVCY